MTSTTTITLQAPVSLGRPARHDSGLAAPGSARGLGRSTAAGPSSVTGGPPAAPAADRGPTTARHAARSDACGPPWEVAPSRAGRAGRAGQGGRAGVRERWGAAVAQGSDAGMATAEYAIAMIAAVGFASLLVTVLSSGTVRGLLTGLVTSALSVG